jgi:ELWxxDGT repeat protein
MVVDLNSGPGGSYPYGLFNFNGTLYFSATSSTAAGDGLWKTDGTAAGTVLVAPNVFASDPMVVGGELYFFSFDPATNATELYKTDGTAAGTFVVQMVSPVVRYSHDSLSMADLNGILYFTVEQSVGQQQNMTLWKTDGTSSGTVPVQSFAGGDVLGDNFVTANGQLFFAANDGTNGPALWKTNVEGTSMVWAPGWQNAAPGDFYAMGSTVYFSAVDQTYGVASSSGVYKTDGTPQGTGLVASLPNVSSFTNAGGKLYFVSSASTVEPGTLYVTDGTASGTKSVAAPLGLWNGGSNNGMPMLAVNGRLYFAASQGGNAPQLWQTDGTTTALADPSEAGWSAAAPLGVTSGGLVFAGTDVAHGTELWDLPIPASVASAAFIDADAKTGGTWSGHYGSDGYSISGGGSSLPAYATLETYNAQYWQWAGQNQADLRAPEVSTNSSARGAACDFSGSSFTVDLNLTDGQSHQVAFYLLDYDYQGRVETIQISNADTGQVLDTRTVSNFEGGKYLVYTLSGHVKITFTNAGPLNAVMSAILFDPTVTTTASFAGVDSTTQGQWTAHYGTQGYDVIGGSSNLPSQVDFTFTGEQFYNWATSTTDARDLQTGPSSTNLVAACAYSDASSFSLALRLKDDQVHQVALYLLDYDYRNRAETIQITNSVTGAVLDTETIAGFTGGKYLRWNLSGDVTITFSNAGGLNEVLSGVFFDPPAPLPATATFVKADLTTEGSYTGIYGKDGYDVFNSAQSLPSYAALNIPSSVQTYTWAPNPTAGNALQDSPGSAARIAACDYSNNPGFTFNLDLTDGKTHQVALYVLDWDFQHRAETIQITDANTGKVLESQNVSNFTGGKYLVWKLSGDVNITLTNAGGLNEVMSGIFFG